MFEKILNEITKNTLSANQKFKIIKTNKVEPEVTEYLKNKFNNLTINILGKYQGSLLELMKEKKLEGWCWQTTETAIVLLNNYDYIERGTLFFDARYKKYYHSWICFNYKNEEYVLDPSLNLLCKKELYTKLFVIEVNAKILAKDVKKELIKQINNNKQKTPESVEKRLKFLMGEKNYLEYKKNEVKMKSSEDVNAPIYRNKNGYTLKIEKNKIKKLNANYYEI